MENIILSPLTVFIEPTDQETIQVKVTNESAIVDHFTVEVDGLPAGWSSLPENSVPLMPNQETIFQIAFGPVPPTAQAGTYPFRLRLRSTSNPGVEGYAFGNLHIKSVYNYSAALNPIQLNNSGSCQLLIINTGNSDQRFRITVQDTNGRLYVSVPTEVIVIPMGKEERVYLLVESLSRPFTGKAKEFTFDVHVKPEFSEPQMLQAHVAITPHFPRWFIIGVVLLLAVGVGLGAKWLSLAVNEGPQAATATAAAFTMEQAEIRGTAEMMMDEDGDGLSLERELEYGTNPLLWDTDGDGLSDGEEWTQDRVKHTDPLDWDTDGDGLGDGAERQCNPDYDGPARGQCTNPESPDSDGDGIPDNIDRDSSGWPTPTPIPPDNRFEDPSFELDTLTWVNSLDRTPKDNVQVPVGWRFMLLDNAPVPGDPEGVLYAFPEMGPITRDQMSECKDGGVAPICAIFVEDKALKVFKGGLPTRFTLYRDIVLQPGAYRFMVNYFADAVLNYDAGGRKVWADPGSAQLQLCIEGAEYDHQNWQPAEIGQVGQLSVDFVVPTARTVSLFANFNNPERLANNGWFFDNWVLQKTLDYDESLAGRPAEHGCKADMSGALTN